MSPEFLTLFPYFATAHCRLGCFLSPTLSFSLAEVCSLVSDQLDRYTLLIPGWKITGFFPDHFRYDWLKKKTCLIESAWCQVGCCRAICQKSECDKRSSCLQGCRTPADQTTLTSQTKQPVVSHRRRSAGRTHFVQLQRRWRQNTLHFLFDSTRLPRSLWGSEWGFGLGLVKQEGSVIFLMETGLLVETELGVWFLRECFSKKQKKKQT